MTGIVYGVKNLKTGKVEMVGSTINSLKERTLGYRELKWFREGAYELIPLRFVSEDSDSFLVYLRAVENCEIARRGTWVEEGGRNKMAPLVQWIGSLELLSERGRLGGKASTSGRKLVESGRWAAISALGRKKNQESGQPKRLGRQNADSGLLARLRTPAHQSKAGRLGGVKGGHTQGLVQGPKNVESGLLASVARQGGQATCHLRWHTRRGIVNSNCSLCREPK
jgi:hypothetical protein